MKYRINKGTETYAKLDALYKRMQVARKAAYAFVKSVGATQFASASHVLEGGVGGVVFDKKPEGWTMVGKPWQNLYFPKVKQKELLDKIRALPLIANEDLNAIVGFKDHGLVVDEDSGSFSSIRRPGVQWVKDCVLVDVPNKCKYTPPNADIVEILTERCVESLM